MIVGVIVGLVALGLVGWATFDFWRAAWDEVRAIFTSQAAFRAWIGGFGVWAPTIYLLVVAVQVIAAPIPGSVLPPVGAAAFGPAPALLLTLGGMLLGSMVVFALVRWWGRPLAARLVGSERLDRYTSIVSTRGGLWLFLIYLLPLLPDDVVSAVAGLSTLSFRRFLLLSMLGRLPGTVVSVYATVGLLKQPTWVWLVAAMVLAVGLVGAIRYRVELESWLLRRSRAGEDGADATEE